MCHINRTPAAKTIFCAVENIEFNKCQDGSTETGNSFKIAAACGFDAFSTIISIFSTLLSQTEFTFSSTNFDRHSKVEDGRPQTGSSYNY
jgi:hypothetical protein